MEFNFILLVIFWASIFLLLHTYVFYPLVILFISLFYRKLSYIDENHFSKISILISAFNEENVIEKRVRNIADQHIDLSKVEVLIGSDGSTDRTNEILLKMKSEFNWISVFIFNKQRGKANVLNDLVEKANNDILIFTDANTVFNSDSVRELTNSFIDDSVGGVSGRLILVDSIDSSQKGIKERAYWEYETFIKKSEGRCGILIGANGGIFAIRKELYKQIPTNLAVTDDFFITLAVLEQNRKFIYQWNAVGKEEVAPNLRAEFKRKIRFASTNFQTLSFFKNLLLSNNYRLSFAVISHKLIRWFVPLFLVIIFPLNILLLDHSAVIETILIFQIVFYCLVILGFVLSSLKFKPKIITLFSYFVLTNSALLLGLIKYLRKKHTAFWESTPR